MYIGGAQPECRVLAEIEKFKFSIISTPRKGFESVKVLIQTGSQHHFPCSICPWKQKTYLSVPSLNCRWGENLIFICRLISSKSTRLTLDREIGVLKNRYSLSSSISKCSSLAKLWLKQQTSRKQYSSLQRFDHFNRRPSHLDNRYASCSFGNDPL